MQEDIKVEAKDIKAGISNLLAGEHRGYRGRRPHTPRVRCWPDCPWPHPASFWPPRPRPASPRPHQRTATPTTTLACSKRRGIGLLCNRRQKERVQNVWSVRTHLIIGETFSPADWRQNKHTWEKKRESVRMCSISKVTDKKNEWIEEGQSKTKHTKICISRFVVYSRVPSAVANKLYIYTPLL